MSGDRNEDYEQYVRWRTEDDPNEFVITRAEFEKTTELLDKVRKGILTKPVVYRNPQDRNPYEQNSYNPHLWSDYIRENLPEHVQKYRDHVAKEKRKRFNQSEIVVTAELVDHALQCGKDAAYKNYVSYMEKKSSISGIKLPILTQEQFEKHKNHIRSKHGFLSTVRNYPLSFEEDHDESTLKARITFGTLAVVIFLACIAFFFTGCAHVSDKSVTIENLYVDAAEREIRI